jgi:FKBP-type peptidyl-prolyl cis-trans isomerase
MRDEPFIFTLGCGQVIRGWDEGIAQMTLGERAKLTISPEWGYGERGFNPIIPDNAVLIFEIELLAC